MQHSGFSGLKILFLTLTSFGFLVHCSPQEKISDVAFLKQTPSIDGKLDTELAYLPAKEFPHFFQFDNPETTPAKVTYRMGYTPTHLYLYIETDADKVSYHRRGYLWGDGYKLLLGIPQKQPLTSEYYDLSFSPTKELEYMWDKHRVARYNFSQETKKLSSLTSSQENSTNGTTGFEALIAWSDIEPYHPWFLDQVGYNLYFAKGINSREHGYFTNGYAVVEDEGIWDEEIERRNYKTLSFENPKNTSRNVVITKPQKQHLSIGAPLIVNMVSIGPQKNKKHIKFSLIDTSGKTFFEWNLDITISKNRQKKSIPLDVGILPAGNYFLVTDFLGAISRSQIAVIPNMNFENSKEKLLRNRHQLQTGTVNTLFFKLSEIENKVSNLKNYETGQNIWNDWRLHEAEFNLFEAGIDPYKKINAPYRRAFKSKYDGSYQPYTIKLPKNYNPNKAYPLLVFMHGSGRDEQGLLDRQRSNGKFIELAPYARDKFRAYASDASQKDIVEAIDDVVKHFSVNKDQIIIGGFSMGGYGALRAFYENPNLYRGVAVFAGHPNLASEWLDEEHPNFLDKSYLSPFSNVPVFIYHGRKDAGLDVNLIEEMGDKLVKNGALVTKSIVEENGHEYQDEATNALYFDWLDQIINKK